MRTTPSFLDLSQATEIAGDQAQLIELVRTFEDSLSHEWAQLQAAFENQDGERVQMCLHALKGFMPLFCHPDLAQAMVDLYQMSREQPFEATQARFRVLEPSFLALQKEVKAWLGAL